MQMERWGGLHLRGFVRVMPDDKGNVYLGFQLGSSEMVVMGWQLTLEFALQSPCRGSTMNPAREDLRTRAPTLRWTSHARKSKVEATV